MALSIAAKPNKTSKDIATVPCIPVALNKENLVSDNEILSDVKCKTTRPDFGGERDKKIEGTNEGTLGSLSSS